MFFLLSKILSFLIHPFSWCLILLILARLLKKTSLKKQFRWLSLIVFLVFSNTAFFHLVVQKWESRFKRPLLNSENSYNIIVLGGYASVDKATEELSFTYAADRLMQALPLLLQNPANQLILSGGTSRVHFKAPLESDHVKRYLESIHIDSTRIRTENQSRNTHENALYVAQMLKPSPDSAKVILVTSAFHMYRAYHCFVKQGIDPIPYPAQMMHNSNPLQFQDYLIPSLNTLNAWSFIIKEWIGIVMYKLKGFI